MKNILAAFTKSQLQTFRTILQVLAQNKVTIQEALEFITEITKVKGGVLLLKTCPKCGGAMRLFPVNESKATQVGGDFNTQWQCPACGHDVYSKATIHEEIEEQRRLQNGNR